MAIFFRKYQYLKDPKMQPITLSGDSSQMSSCFSPIRNDKQRETQVDHPTVTTIGRVSNYLRQESVMSSKSAGDNLSSGMEMSKMSIFSPVLSSTIMHGPDRHERLSPIMSPSKSLEPEQQHPKVSDSSDQEGQVENKCTPKLSIIEKVCD